MRELEPIPDSLFDARGVPNWGSYRGAFPRVDLESSSLGDRIFRRKRWMWSAIATSDLLVAAAVVDLGYAANAFAFACDDHRMLVDRSAIGARARVSGNGEARIRGKLAIELSPSAMRIQGRDIDVDATFDASHAPPAITAVARAGKINVTQKRALLASRGRATVAGRSFGLEGSAGYDFTCGLLARKTAWRWAFGLGRDAEGAPLAFNLVEGFVGAAECALFRASTTGLDEARFSFGDPMRPWRVETEGVDLRFEPVGVHEERKNLLVVRSRFIQAAGKWSGTVGGARIADMFGVAEDQDVVW